MGERIGEDAPKGPPGKRGLEPLCVDGHPVVSHEITVTSVRNLRLWLHCSTSLVFMYEAIACGTFPSSSTPHYHRHYRMPHHHVAKRGSPPHPPHPSPPMNKSVRSKIAVFLPLRFLSTLCGNFLKWEREIRRVESDEISQTKDLICDGISKQRRVTVRR
ncbi:unnamed protein product [Pleuronectes platessa]|uniref:Uncharacterized protein n=1 Tax=Pleuronectes platessa TaxID=8262 RepID=A0A9N7VBH0_PLEPL|nr:unnamed protein product [Pleuronectes platessa]